MAVAAVLNENQGVNESGNRRRVKAVVTWTAETHSNGYSIPASLFGYKGEIEFLVVLDATPGDSDQYKWDEVNQTIRIYEENAGTYAEVVSSLTRSLTVEAIGW